MNSFGLLLLWLFSYYSNEIDFSLELIGRILLLLVWTGNSFWNIPPDELPLKKRLKCQEWENGWYVTTSSALQLPGYGTGMRRASLNGCLKFSRAWGSIANKRMSEGISSMEPLWCFVAAGVPVCPGDRFWSHMSLMSESSSSVHCMLQLCLFSPSHRRAFH